MAIYIKGEKVANATSYELHKKVGGGYTKLATNTDIDFEVSALGLGGGAHTLVVKAKADGYADSDYSNEVIYDAGDVDAAAFLSAANITDSNTSAKITKLVTDLKINNLWDKIEALYPCVGSTFDQMSYNLKDVNAYRLTTTGTPTVTENVGFYCDKGVKSNHPERLGDDMHLLGYSGTTKANVTGGLLATGPSSGSGMGKGVLALIMNGKVMIRTQQTTNRWYVEKDIAGNGLFIGSLTSGIVYNGENLGAEKQGTPSIASYPDAFVHNGYNATDGSVFDANAHTAPFEVRMSGFGHALTIEEMQTYSLILNEFKSIY